jgi:hypothetical protein
MEPNAQGYNWTTLFLRDTNMRTWPSRLGESHMGSAGLRPASDCTGKAQKQFYKFIKDLSFS